MKERERERERERDEKVGKHWSGVPISRATRPLFPPDSSSPSPCHQPSRLLMPRSVLYTEAALLRDIVEWPFIM